MRRRPVTCPRLLLPAATTSSLPPGPGGTNILRLPAARRDPVGFLRRMAAEHGDIVHFRLGRTHVVLLNDPRLIQEVLQERPLEFGKGAVTPATKRIIGDALFADDGEHHDRQRRAVQPMLRHDRLGPIGQSAWAEAMGAADALARGGPIDGRPAMLEISYRLTMRNLLGEPDGGPPELRAALEGTLEMFTRTLNPFAMVMDRLPLPSTRRQQAALKALRSDVDARIRLRQEEPKAYHDTLAMLVAHRFTDGGAERMSQREVRDEALDLVIGSYETVAAALGWSLYLLACHPEEQTKVAAEAARVLGGRAPSLEGLQRMPYARAAVREALRLYPPAWGYLRRASANIELAGYRIPRGALLALAPAVTHHDPRFFPDPERYDPGRWLARDVQKGTFFPFGMGPRSCVGEPLAMAELMAATAALCTALRLTFVGARAPRARALVTLFPASPITVRAQRR